MKPSSKGPRYLMRWDHSRDQRLGRDLVTTTHRLAELTLFSDKGLASVIDRYPREALQVSTMGNNPAHPSQSRMGRLGSHSGIEWIDMIRRGRLCLRIKNVAEHHDQLCRIVQRLCGEMVECQPGLRTCAHNGDLEISSPSALVYYRHDVNPNVFWQVRGTRNVWVYPAREPFVKTNMLEVAIALRSQKPLYFEPAFDNQAQRLPQTSGDVFALPQHTPYRVVNDQHLSVTLITSYETSDSRRRNQIHLANHMLRQFIPAPAVDMTGIRSAAKRMLLRVWGTPTAVACRPSEPTFCVDPDAPLCVGPLETAADESDPKIPTFPGLNFEASTSASAVSES